jgi:hypothetical protein
MSTDEKRPPIEIRNEIVIPAVAGPIWDLLTDVERWPTWYRACRWVRRVGTVAGTGRLASFQWKAHPVTLISNVIVSDRPRRFAIDADAPGIHAERSFTLQPPPNGAGTVVVSHETQVGPMAWLGRWILGPRLRAANDAMFADLARAATKRDENGEKAS